MQHTADHQEIIPKLAAALADSGPSLTGRLQQCLSIIREALNAGRGALHLFPDREQVLLVQEQNVLHLPYSSDALDSGGVISSVLSRPGPVLLTDNGDEKEAGLAEAPSEYGPSGSSLLAAPLFSEEDGSLLGVLHLMSSREADEFTRSELDRLTAYCQWIAPFVAEHFRNHGAPLEEHTADSEPAAGEEIGPKDLAEEFEFVVHDLKSPLSALITNLDLLHSLSHTEKQASLTQTALASANKLYLRINQILDLFRLEERLVRDEPLPHVDLEEAITRQIQEHRPLLDRKELEVWLSGPGGTRVPAEWSLLGHILQNLLSNAIRHTPVRGSIGFTWWTRERRGSRETVVCLEDTGDGIEEEKRREILRCMEQGCKSLAREKSGGLGLVICCRIMHILAGDFWIEPVSPQGTRVCFTLPAHGDGDPESERPD